MSAQQPILQYPAAAGSEPLVYEAYDAWASKAQQAFALAEQLASAIANITLSPVNFNANFSPQLALSGFPTIAPPVAPPTLNWTPVSVPGLPNFVQIPILPVPAYTSQLFSTLQNTIQTLLQTGNIIPAAVAMQLRERAYTEAYAEELRAVQAAYTEFGDRGFYTPTGVLNSMVSDARIDARMKRQQTNRDVYIQDTLTAIENLRFAITSGIQLEQVSIEEYRAQIELQIAQENVQIANQQLVIAQWTAQIQLFDAQLREEIAQIDSAYKVFMAQVEVYRANVEAATAAGNYDERRFQLNLAQQQAIVDTEMKRQDQQFEQMRYLTSVVLEIKKTLAQVQAQLAAAAMSAVNIGASLSSSTSEAVDYSLGISYSGQMASDSGG
jgi:hypothetical protein